MYTLITLQSQNETSTPIEWITTTSVSVIEWIQSDYSLEEELLTKAYLNGNT